MAKFIESCALITKAATQGLWCIAGLFIANDLKTTVANVISVKADDALALFKDTSTKTLHLLEQQSNKAIKLLQVASVAGMGLAAIGVIGGVYYLVRDMETACQKFLTGGVASLVVGAAVWATIRFVRNK